MCELRKIRLNILKNRYKPLKISKKHNKCELLYSFLKYGSNNEILDNEIIRRCTCGAYHLSCELLRISAENKLIFKWLHIL